MIKRMIIAHLVNGEEVKIADIDLKILDHLFECGCKYVRDDEVGVVLNNVAYFSEVTE